MNQEVSLKRSVSLPMLTLYGLGTIIGAGIYVLIGEIAGQAGMYAPLAFLVAAIVAVFTGFTYGELAARLPYSAGEAVYVSTAFNRHWLSTMIGWAVVLTGVVSAAALVNGFSGYFLVLIDLPEWFVVIALIAILGGVAAWGIEQSVWVAAIITVLSLLGLLWVLVIAGPVLENLPDRLPEMLPSASLTAWLSIMGGGFVAFYAYVGFEDMVNIAEEVKHPEQALPRAILIALVVSSILYVLVAVVAVLALPLEELRNSRAPLAQVMAQHSVFAERGIAVLSLLSVVNGALVQFIMASRVIYGMATRGMAPGRFARINVTTRTPLDATVAVTVVILGLALWLPIGTLAQVTSLIILLVFATMHLALLRLKRRDPHPEGIQIINPAVPWAGFLITLGLIVARGLLFL
ncbi:MAG: amino acid permease [Gammaproteobacteria bacterium]